MRYSLLAGGKRIRPGAGAGHRVGDRPRARLGAAAGRGDRADPHLLADPRRPAGDGRRRPAARAGRPATARSARTSRSWPATGCTPRPSRCCSAAPGGGARPTCWPPPRELAAATGAQGMVGGQYIDVAGQRAGRPRGPAPAARAEDRPADRGQRRVRAATGRTATSLREFTAFTSFARELGVLFQIVDDILDVTGSPETLGKQQGSDERLGKRTYVTEFGLDGARELAAQSHARARAALGAGRARTARRRARADHRLHRHPNLLMAPLLDRIDKPQDLHGLTDEELQLARPGGARAHHRHGGGDRRPLRRQPRRVRDRRRAALAARLPARQDPLGRRPPGLSAQGPDRPARPAAHDPQVPRAGAVLRDRTSPSTTSWAPATPRPRSATRSGSRRRCAAATARTVTSSRWSATAR